MGYTHYWERHHHYDKERFNRALDDVRILLTALAPIVAGPNGSGKPWVSTRGIAFNGRGENAHEPFLFPRSCTPERAGDRFDWCKTERKPYDVLVMAVLLVLHQHLDICIASDGTPNEWVPSLGPHEAAFGSTFRISRKRTTRRR